MSTKNKIKKSSNQNQIIYNNNSSDDETRKKEQRPRNENVCGSSVKHLVVVVVVDVDGCGASFARGSDN